MQRHGADAVRLFLVASSQVWVPRRFDENAIRETAGRFLLTFRNVYNGIFAQYANFGWAPSEQDPPVAERPALDRWILSRLSRVEQDVNAHLDAYDATLAARRVMQFMDDDVSKWYVRQSRARFYEVDSADNRAAFATLHEVLVVVCRLLAPFAPFITDEVHRALTGSSVHLAAYTRSAPRPVDATLEAAMDDIRTLAGLGHAARDVADVKVRQPLPAMQCVVPGDAAAVATLGALLASELNVKQVEFVTSTDNLVSLEAKANFRVLGKKFGKETPLVAEAVPAMDADRLRRLAGGESVTIEVGGVERLIAPEDVAIIRRASGAAVVQENGGYGVALDPTITPELRAEGLAREVVSRIQRLRKEAGLAVSDRITVAVAGDEELEGAVAAHRQHIAEEVLAVRLLLGGEAGSPFAGNGTGDSWTATQAGDVDGRALRLALTKEGS
jgi:isoleucyl-tRNA synthetase